MQDWARQLGGDREDHAKAAIYDSDRRVIIVGNVAKKRTHTWLVATDASGNEIFGKTMKDSYSSGAEAVIETSDGSYMLVGFIMKRKRDRNTNGYFMKLDKKGRVKWQKRFGGAADDVLKDVVEMPDGGFMAVGYSLSNPDNEREMWIIRVDKYGNKKAELFIYDSSEDVANAIIRTADNNYIIAGYARFSGKRISHILKIDENCNLIWEMPLDDSKIIEIHDLIELPDSTIMAAGTKRNKGITDFDAYISKFTTEGDTLFSKTYGLGRWEEATSLCNTFDGNIALVGFEKSESYNYSDFWLRKINPKGDILYEDIFRRKTIDFPEAVVETIDNGLILIGSTWHIERGWDYALLKYRDINKTRIDFKIPDTKVSVAAQEKSDVKACITSFMPPVRVDITVNGIVQVPDAYSPLVISERKCMYPIIGRINLDAGTNKVMIAVKDRRGNTVTAECIIYYIPPADMSW